MYCATCDRWENSDLGIDIETCLRCRGPLLNPPDHDFDDDEAHALTVNARATTETE